MYIHTHTVYSLLTLQYIHYNIYLNYIKIVKTAFLFPHQIYIHPSPPTATLNTVSYTHLKDPTSAYVKELNKCLNLLNEKALDII